MDRKTSARKVITLYPKICKDYNSESSLTRVAAYCRVSSASDEQLHSVKAQVDYYKQYITSNPDYTFVGIYADEGISGTRTENREAFRRMIEDCRAGYIDMIITKSVSRFGRNTVDTLKYARELKELLVDIYFEKENIHTINNEGEVLLTLISAVAENESLAMSDNVKWGIRRKYEKGCAGSVPCGKFLGYDKVDGRLVINEGQAAVIRRIYKDFLNGYGFSQIAGRLTADGVPSERGNMVWNMSSIKKMLTNEKYKGDMLFQKTYNEDYITKHRVKNNGELHKYYVENTHDAIIDRDTWEIVQLELERQRQYCIDHDLATFHRNNEKNPLSARITCSICGSTYMLIGSKRIETKELKYWRCSSFKGCKGKEIVGRTFTPQPVALRIKDPIRLQERYRVMKRKMPEERQMLCSDVWVLEGKPESAIVDAWNMLIRERTKYIAILRNTAETTDNPLLRYRANELINLLESRGTISEFDYDLSLKVIDHIEVNADGEMRVMFFAKVGV